MFPSLNTIKTIDFSFLGNRKKKATVIIPVLVYFKNHNKDAVVKVDAALNAMHALYSKAAYDNEKEKYVDFSYREGAELRENPNYGLVYYKLIYMPLNTVHLYMIE